MQTYHERPCLSLTFRLDRPEEVEALHFWRAAFGAATDIEAVDENLFVLHIWPGCWCEPEVGESA